jgi:hypothetical protein
VLVLAVASLEDSAVTARLSASGRIQTAAPAITNVRQLSVATRANSAAIFHVNAATTALRANLRRVLRNAAQMIKSAATPTARTPVTAG